MVDVIEIKGGADEFEAAVVAVVLDHLAQEEKARRTGRDSSGNRLSAWIRALNPERYRSLDPGDGPI